VTSSSLGSRSSVLITSLLFLTIAVDGYDAISLAFAVPSLAQEWGTTPAAFTFPLAASNIGAVAGYMLSGPVSARIGRRATILGAVALLTLATFATVLATTVPLMGVIRLVTGVGLGAVLPASVSLAADLVTRTWRDSVSVVVTMGLGSGSILGGLIGARLLASAGWQAVFWFGGALSTVLFVLLWWRLPDAPVAAAAEEGRQRQGVGALFRTGLRTSTLLLWAFAFLGSTVSYSLVSWLPTFLLEFGFSPSTAALGTSLLGMGVFVSGVTLAIWVRRAGAAFPIMVLLGIAFLCLAATALPISVVLVLTLLALSVVGINSASIGQSTLPISVYPQAARTTGVGFTTAAGRIGAIAGSSAGGLLLALGVPAGTIITLLAVPTGIAFVCLFVVARRGRRAALDPAAESSTALPSEA
jgi:Arabinose efflux permease